MIDLIGQLTDAEMLANVQAWIADITLTRDATGWSFRPHSAKADDFLFIQFGFIGDRDLTAADVDLICRRADRAGYRVDKTREA